MKDDNKLRIVMRATSIYDHADAAEILCYPKGDGVKALDFLNYIDYGQMKICSRCCEVYGEWQYKPNIIELFTQEELLGKNQLYGVNHVRHQQCACEDKNPIIPVPEHRKWAWLGFDYEKIIELCRCCGCEILTSGSRWSAFFCDDCKKKVIELNGQFQKSIVPIGRHSLMNGIRINNNEIFELPAIHDFVMKSGSMFDRIKKLEQWTAKKLSDIFKIIGCADDIFLSEYLRKVHGLVDKSSAFGEMCDFLFSIPTGHTEREKTIMYKQKTSRGGTEIVSHTAGKGYYTSKPLKPGNDENDGWVRHVEDAKGIKVLSHAVVIKVRSIIEKYKGGWEGFLQFCRENEYPLVTDNKLAVTYDGYFPELHRLLDSLKENGLQAKQGPVDFYLMDPFESVMFYPSFKESGLMNMYIGTDTIGTFNDYEIEVFLDERSGDAKVRLKEDNWQKYHHIYGKAVELYKLGDVMGSLFEGGSVYYQPRSYEEIKEKYLKGGFRTDESDIVDCFNNFTTDYRFKGELQLMLDWIVYHMKHRSLVKYGRTYKEHFLIVSTLQAKNRLTLEKLFELSEDKNSFGNGCLALVYPVYHYAESLNLDINGRLKLVITFCRLTHAHPQAIHAVTLLYAVIDIATKGGDIFDPREYSTYDQYYSEELRIALQAFLSENVDLQPEEFIKKYPNNIMALNTLFYALYSLKKADSMEEVVTNVLSFNGDADSVNALALMLWGIINGEKI